MDEKKDFRVTLGFIAFIIIGCTMLFLYTKWQNSEKARVSDSLNDDVAHFCSWEYEKLHGDDRCQKAKRAVEYRDQVESDASESHQYAN